MATSSPSAKANVALAFVTMADDKENAASPSSPIAKKPGLCFVPAKTPPTQKPATPKNRIGLAFINGSPIPVEKPTTPVQVSVQNGRDEQQHLCVSIRFLKVCNGSLWYLFSFFPRTLGDQQQCSSGGGWAGSTRMEREGGTT